MLLTINALGQRGSAQCKSEESKKMVGGLGLVLPLQGEWAWGLQSGKESVLQEEQQPEQSQNLRH